MPDNPLIIGGGISGLSAAYYLAKGGSRSTLLESRPRMGGVIHTERVDGCTLEAGPDSFLSIKPAALDLIRDLGLSDQVIGSNDHLRVTFVRRDGRLVPLPDGLMMMVPTKIMPLVTTQAGKLAHQAAHGDGVAALAPSRKPATNRWPISSKSTTAPKRWTIWPSRCSPASTAAIPAP